MPGDLSERTKRLRLPVLDLAQRAGCDKATAHRVVKGRGDPRVSTVQAIEAALAAEEVALRDYLLLLHPLPKATRVPDPTPLEAYLRDHAA